MTSTKRNRQTTLNDAVALLRGEASRYAETSPRRIEMEEAADAVVSREDELHVLLKKLSGKDSETERLKRALEGVKDWAARSGVLGLEQWCVEALSPTGKFAVFPPAAPRSPDPKDATIKALADALIRNGFWVDGGKDWHSRRCPQSLPPAGAPCTCPDDRQALRLAGRLPLNARHHEWTPDGHDKLGNTIKRCTHPGCTIRKIENCATFWQGAKGRRWHNEEEAEIPPCFGHAVTR